MEVNPEPFILQRLIEEARSTLSPLADKKGISIAISMTALPESVTLDQQKLRQVLYNLLSNAVKFTNEGGRVGITLDATPDHRLRLQVSDTGIGIKLEEQDQLFTEFHQLKSRSGPPTRTRVGPGFVEEASLNSRTGPSPSKGSGFGNGSTASPWCFPWLSRLR